MTVKVLALHVDNQYEEKRHFPTSGDSPHGLVSTEQVVVLLCGFEIWALLMSKHL